MLQDKKQINSITLLEKADFLCFRKGDYQKAKKLYEQTLVNMPQDSEVLSRYANLIRFMGDFEQALYYIDKALKIDENNGYAIFTKIRILASLNKFNDAKELFALNFSVPHKEHRLLQQKAAAACALNFLYQARKIIRHLLQKEPKDGSCWYTLGVIEYKAKKYALAIECFTNALVYRENHVSSMIYRSKSYMALGAMPEALKDYNFAQSINPNDREVILLKKILAVEN